MSEGTQALSVIFGIVALGSAIGFFGARRRRQLNLEEWAVAGRGLGLVLVWVLLAGETFTTFSVLGISGWIYMKGGPTLYVLAYLALGYIVIFFVGPPIWEAGRRFGLQTLGDFFDQRYGSRLLATVVALVGVVLMVVYLQLQLTGLGIIVEVASYERIGRLPAMIVSTFVIAAFVLASGVRGVVWVSVLKDFLLVAVAVVVGVGLPYLHFGGIGPMFQALIRARPSFLTLPGGTTNLTHSWFISTILVNCLLFAWPHFFSSLFTAKSADTIRRNSVLMPLYLLPLALIIFAGCAAILVVPGLANGDLALLTAIRRTFSPWLLGAIGGAGALTAMVPASVHALTASTLIAKNIFKPVFAPGLSDEGAAWVARLSVIGITALALILAVNSSSTLVGLLLLAYSGVAQFAPGIFLALTSRRVSSAGILAGMLAGLALAAVLIFSHRDPFHGLNAGFIGLALNILVVIAVSSLTRAGRNGFDSAETPAQSLRP
jgi:SSS family solute:Na+ symporter